MSSRATHDVLLILDPDVGRAARLASGLRSASRDVRIAHDLRSALECVAMPQPDVVLVEAATLAAGGALLLDRLAALAPWAPLIALAGSVDRGARRALVQRYELHAIHDGDPATLDDVVEPALATARRARRRLAEAELREVIVAKLCHEMRTCLYVIEGYAEILCDAHGKEEVAARIGSTSHLALGLVQDYLDLARLEPRAREAHVAPVELARLFDDLRDDVRRRSPTRALQLDVAGVTAGQMLGADEDPLRALLCHLVTNVAECTRHATVRIEVRAGAAATEFVVASDAHTTADAARKSAPCEPGPGSPEDARNDGLTLAIAFRLSRMLGATLDSDPGGARGARFRLRVPDRAATANDGRAQELASAMPILH